MALPIAPVGAGAVQAANFSRPQAAAPGGFGDALKQGLEQVSSLEQKSDQLSQSMASGGPTSIHELMVANTKASLGVDLLVQTRNRAVEAYQEIMRMQV